MSPRFTLTAHDGAVETTLAYEALPGALIGALAVELDACRRDGARLVVKMDGAVIARLACVSKHGDLVWRTEPVKAGA